MSGQDLLSVLRRNGGPAPPKPPILRLHAPLTGHRCPINGFVNGPLPHGQPHLDVVCPRGLCLDIYQREAYTQACQYLQTNPFYTGDQAVARTLIANNYQPLPYPFHRAGVKIAMSVRDWFHCDVCGCWKEGEHMRNPPPNHPPIVPGFGRTIVPRWEQRSGPFRGNRQFSAQELGDLLNHLAAHPEISLGAVSRDPNLQAVVQPLMLPRCSTTSPCFTGMALT